MRIGFFLLDLFTFLGHLHPLTVHLPVGFLLLALIFHLVSRFQRFRHLDQAVSFTLLAGFASAVLACVFGYFLSRTGDYPRLMLRQHKWAGIGLAACSGILCLVATCKWPALHKGWLTVGLIALAGLLAYTGHQGGTLTHGKDYITMRTLTYTKRPKPVSLEQTYLYEDVIHPLLENRCGQCHAAGKTKGGLSIETLASLMTGGKNGAAVVAGKPQESELYRRITLDPGNEKFMPTDGKTPLKPSETELIRWWIAQANAVEGVPLVRLRGNDSMRTRVAAFLGMETPDASEGSDALQAVNISIPARLDTMAVTALQNKGWLVRWMLHQPAMLDLTLPPGTNTLTASSAELSKLAPNIIWLNLSDNKLTDGDLDFLNRLANLEKLRLEKNPVTDLVCHQLTALKHLQAVNLNQTKVSPAGLELLKKNTSIKRVYHNNLR